MSKWVDLNDLNDGACDNRRTTKYGAIPESLKTIRVNVMDGSIATKYRLYRSKIGLSEEVEATNGKFKVQLQSYVTVVGEVDHVTSTQ